jgi:hypothetical protein
LSALRLLLAPLLLAWLLPAPRVFAGELDLPGDLATHPDGRMPIQDLYDSYRSLLAQGWQLDVIVQSQPPGREQALPIIALRTPQAGEAVWILSGIHGEETAGPNAIAASIEVIAELGRQRPVVLLPLNNPQGYAHNWRYLNTPTWSPDVDGQSVGDSSHLLPDPDKPDEARAPAASSSEAAAITAYILERAERYQPAWSIDLHEDDLISEGYVYSQGKKGAADPLAALAVETLRQNGIALKMGGETRFGEPIEGGIIGPVTDSSIDELMSAQTIIVDGEARPGPGAHTVLVFETPAKDIELQRRVAAHVALLQALAKELAADQTGGASSAPR